MPHEVDMAKPFITIGMLPFLALILSACSVPRDADSVPAADSGQDLMASSPAAAGSEMDAASQTDEQTDDMPDDEVEQNAVLPPLSFTWNTDYASFVTAPQQVRTAAKQACEARGYEVAVMASISLDADSASADFTCRGAGD
jgi:hypothetical protein